MGSNLIFTYKYEAYLNCENFKEFCLKYWLLHLFYLSFFYFYLFISYLTRTIISTNCTYPPKRELLNVQVLTLLEANSVVAQLVSLTCLLVLRFGIRVRT